MPKVHPPEEAVKEVAYWTYRYIRAYAPVVATDMADEGAIREAAYVGLSSEPVQELVEALRRDHSYADACLVLSDGSCTTCDLIRRWTQEEEGEPDA